jgi:hypothetical protein
MSSQVQVGQKIGIDITPSELSFTRIGAQAAVQTIKQQLKEIEKAKFYDNFQDKQGELLRAKVIKSYGETVILDVEGAHVLLPTSGQIP